MSSGSSRGAQCACVMARQWKAAPESRELVCVGCWASTTTSIRGMYDSVPQTNPSSLDRSFLGHTWMEVVLKDRC